MLSSNNIFYFDMESYVNKCGAHNFHSLCITISFHVFVHLLIGQPLTRFATHELVNQLLLSQPPSPPWSLLPSSHSFKNHLEELLVLLNTIVWHYIAIIKKWFRFRVLCNSREVNKLQFWNAIQYGLQGFLKITLSLLVRNAMAHWFTRGMAEPQ